MPWLSKPALWPNAATGIGLKHQHEGDILASRPRVDFFEIHAENYMVDGGPALERLTDIRRHYLLSLHGVGLSLGSTSRPDPRHIERLTRLVTAYRPGRISEHLAWSVLDGHYYNDLLPLPLTEPSLAVVVRNVDIMQQALGQRVLIENPSLYVRLEDNTLDEADFLTELVARTGCGLLLDINNAYISALNIERDLETYLNALPWDAVDEFHLAGHSLDTAADPPLRIDDHGSPVSEVVWSLYSRLSRRRPDVPTLIEWDTRVPTLAHWLEEVELARQHHAGAQVSRGTTHALTG